MCGCNTSSPEIIILEDRSKLAVDGNLNKQGNWSQRQACPDDVVKSDNQTQMRSRSSSIEVGGGTATDEKFVWGENRKGWA